MERLTRESYVLCGWKPFGSGKPAGFADDQEVGDVSSPAKKGRGGP